MDPQAFGLVVLETTFGNLEVQLFKQQCPRLSKNFVQLCLDGYYDNTIVDHVEKDFIAIGGVRKDETDEGDKLADHLDKHKDEFHSRLRFTRRGLLATANREKDANGPEFFFTLGPCDELQNKHSIFGRLKGDSVYCLVDLNQCQVDEDLKPTNEKKIIKAKVLENPFPELSARPEVVALINLYSSKTKKQPPKQEAKLNIKSDKKLSFYTEEEEESDDESEDDSKTRGEERQKTDLKLKQSSQEDAEQSDTSSQVAAHNKQPSNVDTDEDKFESRKRRKDGNEQDDRERRLREVKEKIQKLKKQLECESATKIRTLSERRGLRKGADECEQSTNESGELRQPAQTEQVPRAKRARERETQLVVENFKKKLKEARKNSRSTASHRKRNELGEDLKLDEDDARLLDDLDSLQDDSWLTHKFEPSKDKPRQQS